MRLMRSPAKIVLEREIEARRARVPLPSGAAAQLIVDAPRFVPFGADDVQATLADDKIVQRLPFRAKLRDALVLLARRQILGGLDEIALFLDVAAEHDVSTAASHVGRDGDHLRSAGLCDDLGFACVLLRVQHLVR
jgi:hypothetical protein